MEKQCNLGGNYRARIPEHTFFNSIVHDKVVKILSEDTIQCFGPGILSCDGNGMRYLTIQYYFCNSVNSIKLGYLTN